MPNTWTPPVDAVSDGHGNTYCNEACERRQVTYCVNLVVDDVLVEQTLSCLTMGKTLRLAFELLNGVPQAECVVRRGGKVVAWLHTDFCGRLDDVEVYSPCSPNVASLNPAWRGFAVV